MAGKDDKGGDNPPAALTVEDIAKAMQTAMTPLVGAMTKIHERLDSLDSPQDDAGSRGRDQGGSSQDDEEDPDWDNMTNSELMKSVAKMLKGFKDDVDKRLDDTRGSVEVSDMKAEARRLASEYPDFTFFINEMKAEIEAAPGISLEKAYKLAKMDNPERVAEWEKEHPPEKKEDNEGGDQKNVLEFGGLMPTSGVDRRNEKMNTDDAADAAFDEIFGSGVAATGE